MDITLAKRVLKVKPSPTLAVTSKAAELRAQGLDIIGLGAGEPDFDTPDTIKQAAIDAIQKGYTKYTPVDGLPELKDAIINKFQQENNLQYERNQILVSAGGKHSFYNLCQALLNPGDEVIIIAPYWVSYPDMVMLADGIPVIVNTEFSSGFQLDIEKIERALSPMTKLIVINSPSNPTGLAYSPEELKALGDLLSKHPQVLIATDDMYEHILWSQDKFLNIVNLCPELYERCIVLNGVSKAYSMTGWRIGYAAGPAVLIKAMKTIQSQSTSNPAAVSQKAAEAALSGDQSQIREMCGIFKQRHDFLHAELNNLPGVECLASHGTFYSFPSFAGVMQSFSECKNDVELAERILKEALVALVPGSAFGAPGHMRLSFATSMENLQNALQRLDKLLKST